MVVLGHPGDHQGVEEPPDDGASKSGGDIDFDVGYIGKLVVSRPFFRIIAVNIKPNHQCVKHISPMKIILLWRGLPM